MTSARSQTPMISGSSDEIMITPALLGQVAHDLIDLILRTDVDSPRRLVHDEHRRVLQQPFRDDHLLLVPSAQKTLRSS